MKKRFTLSMLGLALLGTSLTSCNATAVPEVEVLQALITVVNGTGSGTYKVGDTATISTSEQEGMVFIGWSYKGEIVSNELTYSFEVTEDNGGTYTATFRSNLPVTLIVVNGTGSGTYVPGTNVTVKSEDKENYTFISWQVNGENVSFDDPYTFTILEETTITATYRYDGPVTLTVINGSGSGEYISGTEVTVTADTKEHLEFSEWIDEEGETVSEENPYTFTIDEDTYLEAKYVGDDPMYEYTQTIYMTGDDFKILNLTDVQLHDGNDIDFTYNIIDTLVEQEKPDMITLLGDIINDSTVYGVTEVAEKLIKHLDSYEIPWAPIFGNHDNIEYHPEGTKKTGGVEMLIDLFNDCDYCLYLDGPAATLGRSNYLINVVDPDTKEIVESLVFLDSYTNGLDDTSVKFYEDAIIYAKKLNNDVMPKSVLFDHIPIQEYLDAFEYSESIECRDIVGVPGMTPIVCGDHKMFNKIKELGSTTTMICGHDHEDAYYNVWDGITLAHALKSSDGDDEDGVTFRHPMGGLMLNINGEKDILRYVPVTNFFATIKAGEDFPYHPSALPFWRMSGAKLVFDIELPSSGTIDFNIQGTNLMRGSIDIDLRRGAWNRLTSQIKLNAATKSVSYGTLTQIEGNLYHYELDVRDVPLNTGNGEVSCGDETARLVYFHDSTGIFKFRDIHYELPEIPETDQVDLKDAEVMEIVDQFANGLPIKPDPKVTLGATTLKEGDDIVYEYTNNSEVGTATLRVLPSGFGAHKYKGEKVVTFNILKNPDDDTQPGHENAIAVNDNSSYVTNDRYNEFIKVPDWYNCGKKLHIEFKRLSNGLVKSGETVNFSLMGANTNPVTTHGKQVDPTGTWNRLTQHYTIDFSNGGVKIYRKDQPANVLATGVSLGDGWFSIEFDFTNMDINSAENVQCNANETLQRINFDNMTRSFKFDKVQLVDR